MGGSVSQDEATAVPHRIGSAHKSDPHGTTSSCKTGSGVLPDYVV